MNIIALHGFTGSAADWAPLADAMGLPITGIDLVGHGACPAPTETSAYTSEAMVKAVVGGLGEQGPSLLMGYSMGARVALRLALAHPDRVRALVLIGVNPGLRDSVQRAERIARDQRLAARIEQRGMEWFCEHWASLPIIATQQVIPASIRDPMQTRRRANRPAGLAGALRGFGQGAVEPVWDRLPQLDCPVLLLTGSLDPAYGAIANEMADHLPFAVHEVVDGAGHCAHLERLADSARRISDFVLSLGE